jgi:hypothetical protein
VSVSIICGPFVFPCGITGQQYGQPSPLYSSCWPPGLRPYLGLAHNTLNIQCRPLTLLYIPRSQQALLIERVTLPHPVHTPF